MNTKEDVKWQALLASSSPAFALWRSDFMREFAHIWIFSSMSFACFSFLTFSSELSFVISADAFTASGYCL